jgi:non-ribosomal peptide synthase protein (TIGR01720 family)
MRGVPQGGLGYGLLRYMSEEEEVREVLGGMTAEVSFNYHGQMEERREAGMAGIGAGVGRGDVGETGERVVKGVEEVREGLRGGGEEREHELEVVVWVRGGKMEIEWSYSEERQDEEEIRRVASEYMEELEEMMERVRREGVEDALSPSDFPLASLSQEELDGALDELEFEGI